MLDMFFCTDLQYDVELYDDRYIDVVTQPDVINLLEVNNRKNVFIVNLEHISHLLLVFLLLTLNK